MNLQMSEQTVVGKRYTIVVPKAIRKRLQLDEGQKVIITVTGNQMVVEPLPKDPYASLARIIRQPYNERKYETKAEELLKKFARPRH